MLMLTRPRLEKGKSHLASHSRTVFVALDFGLSIVLLSYIAP